MDTHNVYVEKNTYPFPAFAFGDCDGCGQGGRRHVGCGDCGGLGCEQMFAMGQQFGFGGQGNGGGSVHGLAQKLGQVEVGQQGRLKQGDGHGQQQPRAKPTAARTGANQ